MSATFDSAADLRDADAIAADVDRGLVLVAQMAEAKEELKAIETRLKADALARPDEHEALADAEREGRQFIAVGSELALPIVLTADKLVGQFMPGSKEHDRIAATVNPLELSIFYRTVKLLVNEFDDGKEFRAKAAEQLGERAPAFIAACVAVDRHGIPKSDIKCEWSAAAAHAKLAEAAKS